MTDLKKMFLNKVCKIVIKGNNNLPLIFTGEILEYDDDEIIFIDKFHLPQCFKSVDVIAISVKKGGLDDANKSN
jgi:hypothetical protein